MRSRAKLVLSIRDEQHDVHLGHGREVMAASGSRCRRPLLQPVIAAQLVEQALPLSCEVGDLAHEEAPVAKEHGEVGGRVLAIGAREAREALEVPNRRRHGSGSAKEDLEARHGIAAGVVGRVLADQIFSVLLGHRCSLPTPVWGLRDEQVFVVQALIHRSGGWVA